MTGLAIVAVTMYAGFCLALYGYQRSLIYFPQARGYGGPESVLRLPVEGADLEISTRRVQGTQALIYFGGNAEDVSANLASLSVTFPGRALYLMHYRGYAGSSGSPTEATLHADALSLFDQVRAEHRDVLVIGRSLGTGVAVRLASERPVSRLVLVTPYHSLLEIAVRQMPCVPVRWLLEDRFESWRYAPQVVAPTTILVAGDDEVIPDESSRLLFSSFPEGVANYVVIDGAGHNTIASFPAYLRALADAQ